MFRGLVKLFQTLNYQKLSKTQSLKMEQSGEFLGRLLGPLLKISLMKNVLKPLVKMFWYR